MMQIDGSREAPTLLEQFLCCTSLPWPSFMIHSVIARIFSITVAVQEPNLDPNRFLRNNANNPETCRRTGRRRRSICRAGEWFLWCRASATCAFLFYDYDAAQGQVLWLLPWILNGTRVCGCLWTCVEICILFSTRTHMEMRVCSKVMLAGRSSTHWRWWWCALFGRGRCGAMNSFVCMNT